MLDVSVVVPCYRSERTLPALCARITAVFEANALDGEILCIDDGSPDDGATWRVISSLANLYPQVRGFRMMRNFGQHNAVLCGARLARGAAIITMDDDLQHDPEDVPALLAKLDEGHDVVYGIPRKLPHDAWRNWTSRISKTLLAKLMGFRTIQDISAFRAFRSTLREAFESYRAPDLLFDVLLSWGTVRFATVVVDHAPRAEGRSNYTLRRLIGQALLILTGYSTAPLRMASFMGFAASAFGFAVLIYVAAVWAVRHTPPGFTFLASVIAIVSGAQLFALGVIGEYLARMFNRTMDRPTYVVAETAGSVDAREAVV